MQLAFGNILVTATILPAYNLALRHIGQPPVREIRVQRTGPGPVPPRDLTIHLSQPATDWRIPLPDFSRSVREHLVLPLNQLDSRLLESIVRPETATLRLMLGLVSHEDEIHLLGPWQWPTIPDARLALACYAIPGENWAGRIAEQCRPASVDSGIRREAADLLHAVYEALHSRNDIEYARPEAISLARGVEYQKIRTAGEILDRGETRSGQATCLDLTLVFAGVLERLKLSPAIILLSDTPNQVSHAIPAAWASHIGFQRAHLTDSNEIRKAVAQGKLLPVESTGVCKGVVRLEYAAAVQRATKLIQETSILEVISVDGCRRAPVNILPLLLSHDSVVARAQAIAELLGRELDRQLLETLHLLHGVLNAEGPLTRQLLERLRCDRERLTSSIRKVLGQRSRTGIPGRTSGFDRILREARDGAGQRGSTEVQEEDLWRALLTPSSPNVSVSQILATEGLSVAQFRQVLDDLRPVSNRMETRTN